MTLSTPLVGPVLADAPVAVLVDGENVSPCHARSILDKAGSRGALRIRRVYGNVKSLPGWETEPGFDLIHTGSGKNSADMKLGIDAVDLALRGLARRFVLVSSDADFLHLARFLRERGFEVMGMGEEKAPVAFRRACERFVLLRAEVQREASIRKSDLVKLPLQNAVAEILRTEHGNDGIEVCSLNGLVRRFLDVRISDRPEKSWDAFLKRHQNIFIVEGSGAARRLRLREMT